MSVHGGRGDFEYEGRGPLEPLDRDPPVPHPLREGFNWRDLSRAVLKNSDLFC